MKLKYFFLKLGLALYYFDDPEMTLEFPNYGARLRISESGSGTL